MAAWGAGAAGHRLWAAPEARRPNILFILTDDQRWDAMSSMGRPFLKTPNMDRIAREGARFANAFVTTSLCSPSRASFLTGMYAHAHGVRVNSGTDPRPDIATFPMLLQGAGYDTAWIGKWHMARHARPRPGFNYWLSFVDQGEYLNPALNENGRDFQAAGYMTDLLTDYAVKWLRQPRRGPFCLVLAHKAVHAPFTPAERHRGLFADVRVPKPRSFEDTFAGKPEWYRAAILRYLRTEEWRRNKDKKVPASLPPQEWNPREETRLNYYRTLCAVDEGIGRVLETLSETGQLDSTFIVFASDNGYFQGEHGLIDKRLIYEESIRIPLLIRYPKRIKPGTLVDALALNIDLAPTLLELAGLPTPSNVQGRSFLPLLEHRPVRWRTSFLYEYFEENAFPGIPTMLAVRTERWMYARYPELKDLDELYDLKSDPYELRNLAEDPGSRARVKEMRAELERLLKEAEYEPVKAAAPTGAFSCV